MQRTRFVHRFDKRNRDEVSYLETRVSHEENGKFQKLCQNNFLTRIYSLDILKNPIKVSSWPPSPNVKFRIFFRIIRSLYGQINK